MILTIILGILWLILVPFGLGILPCRLLPKKYRSPGMIFALGCLLMMALFECEYLPALFVEMRFQTLCLIFRITVGLLSLISAIIGAPEVKSISFPKWNVFFIVFVLLVVIQCVARWFQGVTDGDDAFFLGTAVNTYYGNYMYVLDPYKGIHTGLDIRHALSPGGVYLAFLSNSIKLHPAITAHIVFADLMLILHYAVFCNIGKVLFVDEDKKASLFACMVCVFDVFGNYSLYTPGTFLITRTWQGKSVIANICIPFAFYLLLLLSKKEETGKMWKEKRLFYGIAAGITMLSSVAMATTGLMLLPPMLFLGAIILSIYRKKWSILLTTLIASIPTLAIGVIFLLLL